MENPGENQVKKKRKKKRNRERAIENESCACWCWKPGTYLNEGDKANKRRGIEIKDNMWRRKTRKKK